MRGRKPKPTAVKVLEGNPGKRALNLDEPKFKTQIPTCPPHLSSNAKTEWRRITKLLHQAGLLTNVDRGALAGYCAAYARWAEAERELKKPGIQWIIETDKGNLVQNPLIGIANKSMILMLKFATEFGMTPSARSRVKAEQNGEEDDLASELFKRVNAVRDQR